MISDTGSSSDRTFDDTWEEFGLKCEDGATEDNCDEAEDGTVILRLVDEG